MVKEKLMITNLYKDHLKKINQKFNNQNIYDFEPNISNDFEKDKVIFSNFWRDCLAENKKELRSIIEPVSYTHLTLPTNREV